MYLPSRASMTLSTSPPMAIRSGYSSVQMNETTDDRLPSSFGYLFEMRSEQRTGSKSRERMVRMTSVISSSTESRTSPFSLPSGTLPDGSPIRSRMSYP